MADSKLTDNVDTGALLLADYCQKRTIASLKMTVTDKSTGERWSVNVKKLKPKGRRRSDDHG